MYLYGRVFSSGFSFDTHYFKSSNGCAVGFRAGRTDEPRQGRKTATVLLCVGAAECLAALLFIKGILLRIRQMRVVFFPEVFFGLVCRLAVGVVFCCIKGFAG